MIKATVLANAVTTTWLVAYLVCAFVAFFIPSLYWGILGSWMHALNLEIAKATSPMSFLNFVWGVLTFGTYVWIITFAGATLYNRWSK